jgi:hypothetical protein
MRKSLKSGFAGVLCASIAAVALPSEGSAGPVGVAAPDLVGMTQQVEQIHSRRPRVYAPRAYYPRRHYNVDVNAAIAGGLAVAGAAVATHGYGYYYGPGYPYPYPYYYGGYPAYYGGWGW